jgi:hypothetical protein
MIFSNAFTGGLPGLFMESLLSEDSKPWKGSAHLFQPMYAPRRAGAGGANMGHPSLPIELALARAGRGSMAGGGMDGVLCLSGFLCRRYFRASAACSERCFVSAATISETGCLSCIPVREH